MIGVSVSDILKVLDQVPGWKAVMGLPKRVKELEERVAALEAKPAAKPAEACPLCDAPMKVTAVRDHEDFGFAGVQRRMMVCTNENCGHSEDRVHDPHGRMGPRK